MRPAQQHPPSYSSSYGRSHSSQPSGSSHYPNAPPPPSSAPPPPPPAASYGHYPPPPRYAPPPPQRPPPQQQPYASSSSQVRRETEEERRERKKREYEMRRQREGGRAAPPQQPPSAHHPQAASSSRPRVAEKRTSAPEKVENRLKRSSTFLCKIKFRNELPDPVSQPKLLRIYNDKDRYAKYSITSMEKNFKNKLYVEPDLGIPLDLLDLSVYNPPKHKVSLDPADAELLLDDEVVVKQKTDNLRKRERPTDKGVAWLVKTTYISPVSMDPAKQSLTEKQAKELREKKEGHKDLLESINDRDRQIQSIEESFRVSKLQPVHQTKPDLKPVEILPLLPDFDRTGDQFVHVMFDTEPTADSEYYSKLDRSTRDYLESRAVVKSYTLGSKDDGKTEKFLAYMVPKLDEVNDDDDEIPYTWIREYHWDVRAEDARNNYVFCFGKDAVQYMPVSSKLVLHKKKAKEGRSKDDVDNQFLVPSSITVRKRELTDEEEYQRDTTRRAFIEGPLDEEHTTSKRKRPVSEKQSASKRRRAYEEEREVVSDDDEVSI